MSTPFATSSSTSTAPTAVSSAENSPPSSSSPRRKSPPPPKLNLDELKPIPASLTDGKTSTSTSFVFTSSRTARSLHAHSRSLGVSAPSSTEPLSSPHDVAPSSLSNSSSPPTSAPSRKNPNAVLSSVQLARHGQGAVDARCIVSPNMRAAGFVPLAYTPLTGPDSSKPSPLGSSSSVLASMDPPCFPPIVFVNPSNMTSTPMWDYQRNPSYGLAKGSLNSLVLSFGDKPANARSSPSMSPLGSEASSSAVSDRSSRCISSSSSVFSTIAASPPQTSNRLSSPLSLDKSRTLNPSRSVEPVVDGYPFPPTPPRTRHESRIQVSSAPVPILQGITETPPITSSTASGSVTPSGTSPITSVASSPPTTLVAPLSSSYTGSVTSSGSSKHSSSTNKDVGFTRPTDLSITELCSVSAQAWVADPVLLPPVKTVRRPGAKSSKMAFSRTTSSKEMKKRTVAKPIPLEPGEPAFAEDISARMQAVDLSIQERSTELSPPVALPAEELRAIDSGKGKSKETERHRGRGKDRERRRQKPVSARAHSSSSPTSAASSPGQDDKGSGFTPAPKKPKDRAHPTKEKASAATHSSYSSFLFPPQQQQPPHPDTAGAHAHTLGRTDVALERERAREAGEYAKDIVLAHRERDRQHARQTESWHDERLLYGMSKKRYAAAEGALAEPLMFATAYDSGYGRGVVRGAHPSLHGHSVETSGSAPSVLSEGDTVVHAQPVTIKLALDA